MIPAEEIKKDFPLFHHLKKIVYLDSTATALKPQIVINALTDYYSQYSANISRGVYDISEKATVAYESTRKAVSTFIGAASEKEIIFTRNATESVNLFVHGIRHHMHMGDEIVTTIQEHHSNFVPWQQLCKQLQLSFVVMKERPTASAITKYVNKKTKVLAITYVSNVLGTVNPIREIIQEAKKINPHIIVLVDGAQAVPHMKIDVQTLGCDAFVFSSHKMLGPTGVGVLWVTKNLLERLAPYQYGGDMIRTVSVEKTEFADVPHRFEAGTPAIAEVIALSAAITYLQKIGMEAIHAHEVALAQVCYNQLTKEFGENITILGPQTRESGIVAFVFRRVHAHDVAQLLNEDHIAVRAGHHCAMPLHTHLGIEASVRASFYLYNTQNDIDKLIASLKKTLQIFA